MYVCQKEVISLRKEFIVSVIFQLFIKATNSYLLYGDSPYLVDILKEMSSEYYNLGVPVIHCQRIYAVQVLFDCPKILPVSEYTRAWLQRNVYCKPTHQW